MLLQQYHNILINQAQQITTFLYYYYCSITITISGVIRIATSNTLSFTVPRDLKLKLEGIVKTGHYDSLSEFLRHAIRSLLTQNKDLRIALAYELYSQEKITLGKAAEIIQEKPSEVKALFKDREL